MSKVRGREPNCYSSHARGGTVFLLCSPPAPPWAGISLDLKICFCCLAQMSKFLVIALRLSIHTCTDIHSHKHAFTLPLPLMHTAYPETGLLATCLVWMLLRRPPPLSAGHMPLKSLTIKYLSHWESPVNQLPLVKATHNKVIISQLGRNSLFPGNLPA